MTTSRSVTEAIRAGRLLEEYKYRYFEEPVMFNHVEEIQQVADALTIPIANGEQDYTTMASAGSSLTMAWKSCNRIITISAA